jgi:hypothetical protein
MAIDYGPLRGQQQPQYGWGTLGTGLAQVASSLPSLEETFEKSHKAYMATLGNEFMGNFNKNTDGSYKWANEATGTDFAFQTSDKAWNAYQKHLKKDPNYTKWKAKGLVDPTRFISEYDNTGLTGMQNFILKFGTILNDPNMTEEKLMATLGGPNSDLFNYVKSNIYPYVNSENEISAMLGGVGGDGTTLIKGLVEGKEPWSNLAKYGGGAAAGALTIGGGYLGSKWVLGTAKDKFGFGKGAEPSEVGKGTSKSTKETLKAAAGAVDEKKKKKKIKKKRKPGRPPEFKTQKGRYAKDLRMKALKKLEQGKTAGDLTSAERKALDPEGPKKGVKPYTPTGRYTKKVRGHLKSAPKKYRKKVQKKSDSIIKKAQKTYNNQSKAAKKTWNKVVKQFKASEIKKLAVRGLKGAGKGLVAGAAVEGILSAGGAGDKTKGVARNVVSGMTKTGVTSTIYSQIKKHGMAKIMNRIVKKGGVRLAARTIGKGFVGMFAGGATAGLAAGAMTAWAAKDIYDIYKIISDM